MQAIFGLTKVVGMAFAKPNAIVFNGSGNLTLPFENNMNAIDEQVEFSKANNI